MSEIHTAYDYETTSTVMKPPAKSNGQPAELRFKVAKDRLELLTVDDLIELEGTASIKALRNILAIFVVVDGDYLEDGAAKRAIGKMSIKQLNETAPLIMAQINEIAAPK